LDACEEAADLAGVITISKGAKSRSLRTEHEAAAVHVHAAKGESYTLHIQQPAGIKTTYPMPRCTTAVSRSRQR
jgi:hypothetical protein